MQESNLSQGTYTPQGGTELSTSQGGIIKNTSQGGIEHNPGLFAVYTGVSKLFLGLAETLSLFDENLYDIEGKILILDLDVMIVDNMDCFFDSIKQ